MSRRLPLAAVAIAATALIAPAAAFSAPTVTADKQCYIGSGGGTETVTLTGTGFTPNADVNVTSGGETAATRAADAAGNLSVEFAAPYQDSGEKAFTIVATEAANAAQTAQTAVKVTAFDVSISPRRARPTSRVTIRARGFTAGGTLYAHYIKGHKVRKTVSLGHLAGACGTLTKKVRQIPVAKPSTGTWDVQFDLQKAYKAKQIPFARFSILVTRTFR